MGQRRASNVVRTLERLRELVHLPPALSLPEPAAEAYARIRAGLESKGQMVGNNDLWIAAHAVSAGLSQTMKGNSGGWLD
jgi:tRNA(fMet)-specific endonuclease VapC